MECGKVGGLREPTGPMGNPAGRARMSVHQVDLFRVNEAGQGPDVSDPAKKFPVINRDLGELRFDGLGKTARSDKNLMALLDLPVDEGRCGCFGPRHQVTA